MADSSLARPIHPRKRTASFTGYSSSQGLSFKGTAGHAPRESAFRRRRRRIAERNEVGEFYFYFWKTEKMGVDVWFMEMEGTRVPHSLASTRPKA